MGNKNAHQQQDKALSPLSSWGSSIDNLLCGPGKICADEWTPQNSPYTRRRSMGTRGRRDTIDILRLEDERRTHSAEGTRLFPSRRPTVIDTEPALLREGVLSPPPTRKSRSKRRKASEYSAVPPIVSTPHPVFAEETNLDSPVSKPPPPRPPTGFQPPPDIFIADTIKKGKRKKTSKDETSTIPDLYRSGRKPFDVDDTFSDYTVPPPTAPRIPVPHTANPPAVVQPPTFTRAGTRVGTRPEKVDTLSGRPPFVLPTPPPREPSPVMMIPYETELVHKKPKKKKRRKVKRLARSMSVPPPRGIAPPRQGPLIKPAPPRSISDIALGSNSSSTLGSSTISYGSKVHAPKAKRGEAPPAPFVIKPPRDDLYMRPTTNYTGVR